eukprot:CAMPEP_0180133144 /NCGR_PEP_ID=MMETSP0986-20121125/9374_1 /TAXON_ID=697907 /ORGANISM="non described non described, Strain CCMP2293" /LENGTH=284 /DNA_ID=CAMNT_0022073223 /DNA_START=253 /DNA_END=1103 /DNA_ORIENTATION=-
MRVYHPCVLTPGSFLSPEEAGLMASAPLLRLQLSSTTPGRLWRATDLAIAAFLPYPHAAPCPSETTEEMKLLMDELQLGLAPAGAGAVRPRRCTSSMSAIGAIVFAASAISLSACLRASSNSVARSLKSCWSEEPRWLTAEFMLDSFWSAASRRSCTSASSARSTSPMAELRTEPNSPLPSCVLRRRSRLLMRFIASSCPRRLWCARARIARRRAGATRVSSCVRAALTGSSAPERHPALQPAPLVHGMHVLCSATGALRGNDTNATQARADASRTTPLAFMAT